MAQPYIGEMRLFAGTFAPFGWVFCDGSLLSVPQNEAMFSLLGTTYGGDGVNTFGVPDMRGRVPVHQGQGTGTSKYALGQTGGAETITLTVSQLAPHPHAAMAGSGSSSNNPANVSWGPVTNNTYGQGAQVNATMNVGSLSMTGGNQAHDNMLPFQVISFIIAIEGIYPTQG